MSKINIDIEWDEIPLQQQKKLADKIEDILDRVLAHPYQPFVGYTISYLWKVSNDE